MDDKGFFGALFDLSFSEFVTTKLIKFLYVLMIILIGIGYLIGVVMGFVGGFGSGLLALIVGAIGAFLGILMARVYMEVIIVLFRIAENSTELVRQNRFRE